MTTLPIVTPTLVSVSSRREAREARAAVRDVTSSSDLVKSPQLSTQMSTKLGNSQALASNALPLLPTNYFQKLSAMTPSTTTAIVSRYPQAPLFPVIRGPAISNEWQQYPVLAVTDVSPDTKLIRLGLPHANDRLRLSPGQHIYVGLRKNDGGMVSRSYTPVTDAYGYFEIIVKTYKAGIISRYIHGLHVDEKIHIKGPAGKYEHPELDSFGHYVMLACGSGITPMFQLLTTIFSSPLEMATVTLVYANRTEDDILLRKELDAFAGRHRSRLVIVYVLSQPKDSAWTPSGHINSTVIRSALADGKDDQSTMVLVCGTSGFCASARNICTQLRGHSDNLFVF
eukprot:TRINITY_DN18838_c0_g1_i1.p1 TRINITY_DN18838_c0_g1~~TRINITY_DN18838_c0_g1_i1.p1  ORF type:complete len:341 (+),score=-44.25 TRINITY_DN18838_c0_g1_i1:159-1181(+)